MITELLIHGVKLLLRIGSVLLCSALFGLCSGVRKQAMIRKKLMCKALEKNSLAKLIHDASCKPYHLNIQVAVSIGFNFAFFYLLYRQILSFSVPSMREEWSTITTCLAGTLFVVYIADRKGRGLVIPCVTGGIGSGKTTVCSMMEDFTTVDVDKTYHELIKHDEPLYHELVQTFGQSILTVDKSTGLSEIDRTKLSEVARKQPENMQQLEKTTQPMIIQTMVVKIWQGTTYMYGVSKNILLDAPLLFETKVGAYLCCPIITITSDEKTRYKRFRSRAIEELPQKKAGRGQTLQINESMCKEHFNMMSKNQMSESAKTELSDIIIRNDGSKDKLRTTVHQVSALILSL